MIVKHTELTSSVRLISIAFIINTGISTLNVRCSGDLCFFFNIGKASALVPLFWFVLKSIVNKANRNTSTQTKTVSLEGVNRSDTN